MCKVTENKEKETRETYFVNFEVTKDIFDLIHRIEDILAAIPEDLYEEIDCTAGIVHRNGTTSIRHVVYTIHYDMDDYDESNWICMRIYPHDNKFRIAINYFGKREKDLHGDINRLEGGSFNVIKDFADVLTRFLLF